MGRVFMEEVRFADSRIQISKCCEDFETFDLFLFYWVVTE